MEGLQVAVAACGLTADVREVRPENYSGVPGDAADQQFHRDLLQKTDLPVIALVVDSGIDHFVVVHRVSRRYLLIADPAQGLRKLGWKEFCAQSAGLVVTATRDPVEQLVPSEPVPTVGRFVLKLLWSASSHLLTLMFCSVIHCALAIGSLLLLRGFISSLSSPSSADRSMVVLFTAATALLLLAQVLFYSSRERLKADLGRWTAKRLRLLLAKRLTQLGYETVKIRQPDDLLRPFQADIPVLSTFLQAAADVVWNSVHVCLLIVCLSFVDRVVAASVCGLCIVLLLLVPLTWSFMRRYVQDSSRAAGQMARWMSESIRSHRENLLYGSKDRLKETEFKLAQSESSAVQTDRLRLLNMVTFQILFAVLLAATLWIGATRVLASEISIANFLYTWFLVQGIRAKLGQLFLAAPGFCRVYLSAGRVLDLLVEETERKADPDAEALSAICNAIRFDSVTYRRPGAGSDDLTDLSMTIGAGATTIVVTSDLRGQTAIGNLLTGLVRPSGGRILFDGRDQQRIDLCVLRQKMAWISNRPFVFQGTVADNIREADPFATSEQISDAISAAGLDEGINLLPEGGNTIVGGAGFPLSATVHQRIEIARAVVRDPDVVILSADLMKGSRTGTVIRELLRGRWRNRTKVVFAVSHEAEDLIKADKGPGLRRRDRVMPLHDR